MSGFEELKVYGIGLVVHGHQQLPDNMHHSVMIDKYGNMHIETSNPGASHINVMLSKIDIDGLIKILEIGKQRLEENRIIDKLKGI